MVKKRRVVRSERSGHQSLGVGDEKTGGRTDGGDEYSSPTWGKDEKENAHSGRGY